MIVSKKKRTVQNAFKAIHCGCKKNCNVSDGSAKKKGH